jgi:hypothetical protein
MSLRSHHQICANNIKIIISNDLPLTHQLENDK